MLLIHQGRHRELQWIASLNVQFRSEGRGANGAWEREAIDLLVVIKFSVLLPLLIEIESILPGGASR